MQNLIEIQEQDGYQVVNARELHGLLGVQTKFSTWLERRVYECGFIENQDFTTFSQKWEKGRPTQEYALSLDMAKHLAMLERNEKGREIRQYFIEIEKEAKLLALKAQEDPNFLWDIREKAIQQQLSNRRKQVRELEEELKVVKNAPRQCPKCGKFVKGKMGLLAHSKHCSHKAIKKI